MKKSVYIHIPFCTNICHYCDFNKFFIKNQPVDDYLDALEIEIKLAGKIEAKTVFIGGGTPSALTPPQLSRLMQMVHDNIHFDGEFTIEANPGDLTAEKQEILRSSGVNRLSLGVQTFDDDLLRTIGRSHQAYDVYQTIEEAKRTGFENISIDLIYALPNQTLDQVKFDVWEALKLDLEHISAYSLIIEPKTVFYQLMQHGKLAQPTEEQEAEMYEWLMTTLPENGFVQYEISNYAKPGFESQHNLSYWNNEDYYGFGAGAHGNIAGVRYANLNVLKRYIEALKENKRPLLSETVLTNKMKMEEEMFLGLRKTEGVSLRLFEEKYGCSATITFSDAFKKHLGDGLLKIANNDVLLTKRGRLLGNEVFQDFLQ